MEKELKKVSFRMDANTVEELQSKAEQQYLSLSAYIRKQLIKNLEQEKQCNE